MSVTDITIVATESKQETLIEDNDSNKRRNFFNNSKKSAIKNVNEIADGGENLELNTELCCARIELETNIHTIAKEKLKREQLEMEYFENERLQWEQLDDEQLEDERQLQYLAIKLATLELNIEVDQFLAREHDKNEFTDDQKESEYKNFEYKFPGKSVSHYAKKDPNNESVNHSKFTKLANTKTTPIHEQINSNKISSAGKAKHIDSAPTLTFDMKHADKFISLQPIGNTTGVTLDNYKWNYRNDHSVAPKSPNDIPTTNVKRTHQDNSVPCNSPDNLVSSMTANFEWKYPDRPVRPKTIDSYVSTMSENFEWKYPNRPVPPKTIDSAVSTMSENFEWKYVDRPAPPDPIDNVVSTMSENFEWKYPNRPIPPDPIDNAVSTMSENFEWKYPHRPVPPDPIDNAVSTMSENFEWKYPDRPVRPKPIDSVVTTMPENFEWTYPDRIIPRRLKFLNDHGNHQLDLHIKREQQVTIAEDAGPLRRFQRNGANLKAIEKELEDARVSKFYK